MSTPTLSAKKIREQKNQLRAHYHAKRQAMAPEERARLDKRICNAFLNLISYRYAKTILLYYPLHGEVDTRPIIARALADGKSLALPRCHPTEQGIMDFYYIQSEADLEEGSYGIMEPRTDLPKFDPDQPADSILMAVPGLAYDKQGYRLGYGRGYYDRYLERREITTAGLIYADFVETALPRGRFDLPVRFIVTEKGVKLFE